MLGREYLSQKGHSKKQNWPRQVRHSFLAFLRNCNQTILYNTYIFDLSELNWPYQELISYIVFYTIYIIYVRIIIIILKQKLLPSINIYPYIHFVLNELNWPLTKYLKWAFIIDFAIRFQRILSYLVANIRQLRILCPGSHIDDKGKWFCTSKKSFISFYSARLLTSVSVSLILCLVEVWTFIDGLGWRLGIEGEPFTYSWKSDDTSKRWSRLWPLTNSCKNTQRFQKLSLLKFSCRANSSNL